jgi:hypothetical protein
MKTWVKAAAPVAVAIVVALLPAIGVPWIMMLG